MAVYSEGAEISAAYVLGFAMLRRSRAAALLRIQSAALPWVTGVQQMSACVVDGIVSYLSRGRAKSWAGCAVESAANTHAADAQGIVGVGENRLVLHVGTAALEHRREIERVELKAKVPRRAQQQERREAVALDL